MKVIDFPLTPTYKKDSKGKRLICYIDLNVIKNRCSWKSYGCMVIGRDKEDVLNVVSKYPDCLIGSVHNRLKKV